MSKPIATRFGFLVTALAIPILAGVASCPGAMDGGTNARLLFSNLNAALLSVSGTAADDVYAVGADPNDGRGPYVLHYDGTQWRRLANEAGGELWWISVTPIDGDFFMGGSQSKVLRFDPADQSFEPMNTPGGNTDTVFGVWGADGSNVWAVGGNLGQPDDSGFIWRFDGNNWSTDDLSTTGLVAVPILYKVWGRAADDVYAVGRLGTVLHYNGQGWTAVPTNITSTLFTVGGNTDLVVAVGGFANAVILESDGGAFVDRAPAASPQLNGVFVNPDGSGVSVGVEGSVARRGPAGWSFDEPNFNTIRDFHAAWVDPDGGIWAVGGNLSGALNDGILAYIGDANISTTVAP